MSAVEYTRLYNSDGRSKIRNTWKCYVPSGSTNVVEEATIFDPVNTITFRSDGPAIYDIENMVMDISMYNTSPQQGVELRVDLARVGYDAGAVYQIMEWLDTWTFRTFGVEDGLIVLPTKIKNVKVNIGENILARVTTAKGTTQGLWCVWTFDVYRHRVM